MSVASLPIRSGDGTEYVSGECVSRGCAGIAGGHSASEDVQGADGRRKDFCLLLVREMQARRTTPGPTKRNLPLVPRYCCGPIYADVTWCDGSEMPQVSPAKIAGRDLSYRESRGRQTFGITGIGSRRPH